MFTLIRQELYKLFMRKKTWVVLVGFVLLTAIIAYGAKSSADNMKRYSTPEYQIENLQDNISYLESDKNNIPDDIKGNEAETKKYLENIDQEITRLQEEITMLKNTVDKNLSWRQQLQIQIENQEKLIKDNKATATSGDMAQWNMELEKLTYLENHVIPPQQDYDFNGFTFLIQLVQQLGQVFLIIGIAVFAADMVSGEWTPPTLKLLLAQPVSRGKILVSKFIATVIASVSLILLVEIIAFFIVGTLYGFGHMDYPNFVGLEYKFDTSILLEQGGHPLSLVQGSGMIIPAWEYLVKLLFTQSLFIIATTAFVFMISSLVKSSMVSMAVGVVSLIATTIIFQISSLQKLATITFTTYSLTGELISGNIAQYYNNPLITESFGIMVMIAWTVITYLVAHLVFVKRDLLI